MATDKFSHRSLTFCWLQFAILYYHSVLPCCFTPLLPQQEICCLLPTWKHVSQPYLLITKGCHPLSILLGDNLSYGKPGRDSQLCDHRNTHYKKIPIPKFTNDQVTISSSSCEAVSPPQGAHAPMVGAVGRVYKQCEECPSCAFCPHNCWVSHVCMSTIPRLPPSLPFSISRLLKQWLAHHSCVCHMYITYMSQVQYLARPSASPSAFQMIP